MTATEPPLDTNQQSEGTPAENPPADTLGGTGQIEEKDEEARIAAEEAAKEAAAALPLGGKGAEGTEEAEG